MFLGIDLPIGPLQLGYGRTFDGRDAVTISPSARWFCPTIVWKTCRAWRSSEIFWRGLTASFIAGMGTVVGAVWVFSFGAPRPRRRTLC